MAEGGEGKSTAVESAHATAETAERLIHALSGHGGKHAGHAHGAGHGAAKRGGASKVGSTGGS